MTALLSIFGEPYLVNDPFLARRLLVLSKRCDDNDDDDDDCNSGNESLRGFNF